MKNKICDICDNEMFYVKHYEPDGEDGSEESYWECPDEEIHGEDVIKCPCNDLACARTGSEGENGHIEECSCEVCHRYYGKLR